ncbi:MAG: DUF1910 domain-containing protein [Tannerella sp.]|jgi:hypothetical protein|nr:DUF1910 domain-containing protein [Tannerella sp.]
MEIRDKLNTLDNYKSLIDLKREFIESDKNEIKLLQDSEAKREQLYNLPNDEVIHNFYNSIFTYEYQIFIAMYSMGIDIKELINPYHSTLTYMEKSWEKDSEYVQMVWMLSIGIMLNIEDAKFNKLVQLVEKDNPGDFLIDFLIRYRIPSWKGKSDRFMFNRPYLAVHELVSLSSIEKKKGLERLEKYLSKEWYRGDILIQVGITTIKTEEIFTMVIGVLKAVRW